jgi:hypothetical protein
MHALRDDIAAIYEEVRALLARLRDEDFSSVTPTGAPLWMATASIVECAWDDARVGRRLAEGRSATRLWPTRIVDVIARRLRTRAYSRAGRRAVLAAWENSFNELFSCINDVAESAIGDDDLRVATRRQHALLFLSESPARLSERLAMLRRALQ